MNNGGLFSGSFTQRTKSQKITFNDSDEEEAPYKIEEDNNFDRALRKNDIFKGKEGRMMFELQQTGKGDSRFMLNKSFKGDMNTDQVSKSLKNVTDAFDVPTDKMQYEPEKIKGETNNNLHLLSSILSNSEFLSINTQRKGYKPNDLIVKRFDPLLGLGKEMIIPAEEQKEKSNIHTTKLQKGYAPLMKKEYDQLPQTSSKDRRDKDLSEVINHIQEKELKDVKVEVNYNFFKSMTKQKTGNDINENQKEITVHKPIVEAPHEKKEKVLSDEALLKKKRRKELEKQAKQIEKETKVKIEEKKDRKFKNRLLQDFDSEKVDNYLRMINLVSQKKHVPKS